MGWRDAFGYIQKKLNSNEPPEAHKEGSRIDANLPLRARLGSVLTIQQSPLLQAMSAGSLLQLPEAIENRIVSISRLKCGTTGRIFRYYLDINTPGGEKYLQVYCDENGEVTEMEYCSTLYRLIPDTVEEQQCYTGEQGYGLGEWRFAISRDQLLDLGWDEASVNSASANQEEIEFLRDAGNETQGFMSPFQGVEMRVDDEQGRSGLEQDIVFMPYVRRLPNQNEDTKLVERLWISTEIIRSKNGDTSQREIHVDFGIAIPLDLNRVTIQ